MVLRYLKYCLFWIERAAMDCRTQSCRMKRSGIDILVFFFRAQNFCCDAIPRQAVHFDAGINAVTATVPTARGAWFRDRRRAILASAVEG